MAKKILYTEVDEDITSLFDRLKRVSEERVFLIVPSKAVILKSLVNLKILNKKVEELEKNIVIVTPDRAGRDLAAQAGIETKAKLTVRNDPSKTTTVDIKQQMKPVRAVMNQVSDSDPQRIKGKKIRLTDIVHDFRNKKSTTKQQKWQEHTQYVRGSNRKYIYSIGVIGLALFFLVLYIAWPGAIVYIKPKSEPLEQPANVILTEKSQLAQTAIQQKNNVVSYTKISNEFEKNIFFPTTNQEFTGTNAQGKVTVYNNSDQEWTLRNKTQLQSEDGIVYRLDEAIRIPPRVGEENGNTTVSVTADTFDIYGNIAGEKGNKEEGKLIIKNLTSGQQQIVWAEVSEPLQGGVTKYKSVITESDVETAKKKIELELLDSAKEYMEGYIADRNTIDGTRLKLLDDPNYINSQILEMKYAPDLIGQELDKFEIYAKIKVEAIAFDYGQLVAYMTEELSSRLHPKMKLNESSISEKSINYKVQDENEQKQEITLSASIQGVQEYIIEPTSESGIRFSKKLKDAIMGLPHDEAIATVSNFPEVADAEIVIWSLFSSNIPNIPESIEIRYKED